MIISRSKVQTLHRWYVVNLPAKGLVMLSNALVWMSEAECP